MENNNKLTYDQLLNLNTHLIAKNKRLEGELNRRNNYIAELSNRLRMPLSAIFGMTSIAGNSLDDEHLLKDCLEKIDFSAHMMLNTVNEILELDAVRKGKLSVHNACFDFKLLISSISSMCCVECGNKDIYYDVALNGVTEESLIGDSYYLNRALMLLLVRAVDATGAGGHVKLRISQRDITKSFVQIQFCVIDTGRALTPDEIARYNEDSDDSDIALVKNLCTIMNGTFSFESKKGIGSVFSMSVPFGINPAAQVATQDIVNSYRVLLVTDDDETRRNVTDVLKRIGAECIFVPDSEKATIALLEASTMNKDFNLCMVDWGNSAENAVENTRAIRAAGNERLKIAAIADIESADLQLKVRMSGADRVLSKPLFQSTVFNLMMELTGREYTQLTAKPNEFDFSGCKVLFAEDNDLSAQITASQLNAVGILADRAENGIDCLEILKSARLHYYDLILLDMRMPYMDGCETAKAIRALGQYNTDNMPIIAFTSDALSSDISAAFDAGMNEYIVKPVDTFSLYTILAKYIKKK